MKRLKLGSWGLLLLGIGGCQLIGPDEGTVTLTARPSQIVVENRTRLPLCVWMIDVQTLVLADIVLQPCRQPNVEVRQTKSFPVQVPEGEVGVEIVVFWATFPQNNWRWRRVWVSVGESVLMTISGQ